MKEDIYFVGQENPSEPFYIQIAGVSYCDGTYVIDRKNSSVLCMEYVINGNGTVCFNNSTYHPKKNDIYMLMYGNDHFYYSDSDDPWEKIWFNAAGPLVERLIGAYQLYDTVVISNTNAYSYFDRIVELCSSGQPAEVVNTKSAIIFHELIQYLYRLTLNNSSVIDADALKMKSYIDAHISDDIAVSALAGLIYKSCSQAMRIFKSAFNTTPYDYLLNQRFDKAKTMLLNTNMQVKEIAYQTGFSDEHYFSYMFKKKCGVTPMTYRSSNKSRDI
ncbi:MAG: AraC family transcriptional regulator [Clostridiales bacterium]|nr:AraC family transcriptional regulator [Clostridiales bacterium]